MGQAHLQVESKEHKEVMKKISARSTIGVGVHARTWDPHNKDKKRRNKGRGPLVGDQ